VTNEIPVFWGCVRALAPLNDGRALKAQAGWGFCRGDALGRDKAGKGKGLPRGRGTWVVTENFYILFIYYLIFS
jgi:hypothetical protein